MEMARARSAAGRRIALLGVLLNCFAPHQFLLAHLFPPWSPTFLLPRVDPVDQRETWADLDQSQSRRQVRLETVVSIAGYLPPSRLWAIYVHWTGGLFENLLSRPKSAKGWELVVAVWCADRLGEMAASSVGTQTNRVEHYGC